MPDPVAVPPDVAEQARKALAERARTAGIEGANRQAVVCAMELAQAPFVSTDTLALVGAWHAANPHAVTGDGRCTRLAGLYGGAAGKRWALDHEAVPTTSWLAEESATLDAFPTAWPDDRAPVEQAAVMPVAEDPLAVMAEKAHAARSRLEERVTAAAQVAMRDALRRAGVKITQRASRRSKAAKDAVAAAQGRWTPAVLAATGMTEQDLIRQAFDSLGERYEQWVVDAARAQLRAVASVLGIPNDEMLARMRLRTADIAKASSLRLNEDLTRWAYRLLAEPEPSFGDVGEVPVDPTLPRSILEPSLALADGRSTTAPYGDGLLLEAWLTFDPNAPVEVVQWECGDPARPFPPHHDLCGTVTEWADYAGTYQSDASGFPRGETYWFPGDHTGCECSYAYSYRAAATGAA